MWVTLLDTPSADAISSMERCRLSPMVGGASNSTTPSLVVRNAAWSSPDSGDPPVIDGVTLTGYPEEMAR
jgi:hypothetical protein